MSFNIVETKSNLDFNPLLKNTQAYTVAQKFLNERYLELIKHVKDASMREEKLDYIERMAEVEYLSKHLERQRVKVEKR